MIFFSGKLPVKGLFEELPEFHRKSFETPNPIKSQTNREPLT